MAEKFDLRVTGVLFGDLILLYGLFPSNIADKFFKTPVDYRDTYYGSLLRRIPLNFI